MKLYEIDNEILGCVDAETGEVFDEGKFEALCMERDSKVENLALWVKELRAEANALKTEKLAFAQRQKATENKLNRVENFLTHYLDGAKFKTTKVQIGYKKSTALAYDEDFDVHNIPAEFLKFTEPTVNGAELTRALKAGEEFAGVKLEEKQNIQIK